MYMNDFNQAIQAFGANQGQAHNYIAAKRDAFFKDYKDKLGSAVAAQAEAMGLDEEKQEKVNNLVDTVGIGGPVIGGIVKKGYNVYKARKAAAAAKLAKPATKPSSVDEPDDTPAETTTETPTEATTETPDVAEKSPEQELFGEEGYQAENVAQDTGGAVAKAGGLPSELNLSKSSGGVINQTPDDYEAPTDPTVNDSPKEPDVDDTPTENPAVKTGSDLAKGEETIAETGEEAEAAAPELSEFILPAMGLASIGYSIYDLFHHRHSKEQTADPASFISSHSTGISDSITRGGYAAAGLDSVTSLPAQNSAF